MKLIFDNYLTQEEHCRNASKDGFENTTDNSDGEDPGEEDQESEEEPEEAEDNDESIEEDNEESNGELDESGEEEIDNEEDEDNDSKSNKSDSNNSSCRESSDSESSESDSSDSESSDTENSDTESRKNCLQINIAFPLAGQEKSPENPNIFCEKDSKSPKEKSEPQKSTSCVSSKTLKDKSNQQSTCTLNKQSNPKSENQMNTACKKSEQIIGSRSSDLHSPKTDESKLKQIKPKQTKPDKNVVKPNKTKPDQNKVKPNPAKVDKAEVKSKQTKLNQSEKKQLPTKAEKAEPKPTKVEKAEVEPPEKPQRIKSQNESKDIPSNSPSIAKSPKMEEKPADQAQKLQNIMKSDKDAKCVKQENAFITKHEPTLKPIANFDPVTDCAFIRIELKKFYLNKDTELLPILCSRTWAQRKQIIEAYKQEYGKDLVELVKSKGLIVGNFRQILLALLQEPYHYLARELHSAMKGLVTHDGTLTEILCTKTNEEIKLILEAYKSKYQTCLKEDVNKKLVVFSRNYKKLLINILDGKRDEAKKADRRRAEIQAKLLRNAGERRFGTDEEIFIKILTTESYPHLQLIFEEYGKIAKQTFEEAVESELSGNIRKAVDTIMRFAINPIRYYSFRFEKAMKGLGTNDDSLIRLCVLRSEIDLKSIAKDYEECFNQSLCSKIKKDASGDYLSALLALLGSA